MTDAREHWKKQLWDEVDRRRDELIQLLVDVVQRPSDNPPGDTTELAAFVRTTLAARNIPVDVYEPLANNPNIVATISGRESGRHLLLNGHLDQFPVERPDDWRLPPYSGAIEEGYIYGRGTADMKGGTTALLAATLLLAELQVPLKGRLTLTLVSDEETGGRWGTEWLLDNQPDLLGDAVLNAEPSSPEAVYVAEKGVCWLKVTTFSPGGHSGLSPLDNAIYKMSTAIQAGLKLRGKRGTTPAELADSLAAAQARLERLPYGKGQSWVYDSVTLNVGTIAGGVKANVIPAYCEAVFDYRLPIGVDPEALIAEFQSLLHAQGLDENDVAIEPIINSPPSHTDPAAEIVQLLVQNVEHVTGKRPATTFAYGGSDCRFWRWKGVQTAICGPRAHNIGGFDERIPLDDYITVLKAHLGTIIDYLGVVA